MWIFFHFLPILKSLSFWQFRSDQTETLTLHIYIYCNKPVWNIKALHWSLHIEVVFTSSWVSVDIFPFFTYFQKPVILAIFVRSDWNLNVAHLHILYNAPVKYESSILTPSYRSGCYQLLGHESAQTDRRIGWNLYPSVSREINMFSWLSWLFYLWQPCRYDSDNFDNKLWRNLLFRDLRFKWVFR